MGNETLLTLFEQVLPQQRQLHNSGLSFVYTLPNPIGSAVVSCLADGTSLGGFRGAVHCAKALALNRRDNSSSLRHRQGIFCKSLDIHDIYSYVNSSRCFHAVATRYDSVVTLVSPVPLRHTVTIQALRAS